MDFKKFQQWCENKGFVVKMPSGYSKLINLEVSSFESFKGIFNLCMLFFYEELYRQRDEEMEYQLKSINQSPVISFNNGSSITPLSTPNGTVRSNYNQISCLSSRRYSDEDIQKVFNYLLTPNDDGTTHMDGLLTILENKAKHENFKAKWCDLGKKERNKEYENSELKSLVDRVAEKYDSED